MCTMMPTFACVPAVSAAQRVFGLFQPARNHDSYGYLLTCYHVTCYLVIRSLATYYFVCNLIQGEYHSSLDVMLPLLSR